MLPSIQPGSFEWPVHNSTPRSNDTAAWKRGCSFARVLDCNTIGSPCQAHCVIQVRISTYRKRLRWYNTSAETSTDK